MNPLAHRTSADDMHVYTYRVALIAGHDGLLLSTISVHTGKETELDDITELRNQESVRSFFVDSRPLDIERNRIWLRSGMKRPQEGLLSIIWAANGSLLGTIGWTRWKPSHSTASFGRFVVSRDRVRALADVAGNDYPGVAIDAALSLRDFAFLRMGLTSIATFYMVGNTRTARVNRAIGVVHVSTRWRRRPEGSRVETIELVLTKERWQNLQ